MKEKSNAALVRHQAIDRCLQRGHLMWNYRTLSEAVGEAMEEHFGVFELPSRATLLRDIKFMRQGPPGGYGAPIAWDAGRNTYHYTEKGYSINGPGATAEDLGLLADTLGLLRAMRLFRKEEEGLELLRSKLARAVAGGQQGGADALMMSMTDAVQGQEWIGPLWAHLRGKNALWLAYKPFEEERKRVLVSPYILREYNRRWFLIGYGHREGKIRTFALDRLLSAEQALMEPFYALPGFDARRYFDDIMGVSKPEGQPIAEVLLWAAPLRARYLQTKPGHRSQRAVGEQGGGTVFSYRLIPNVELERWVLSMGEEVQVLEPAWLAERLLGRLRAAVQRYADGK